MFQDESLTDLDLAEATVTLVTNQGQTIDIHMQQQGASFSTLRWERDDDTVGLLYQNRIMSRRTNQRDKLTFTFEGFKVGRDDWLHARSLRDRMRGLR